MLEFHQVAKNWRGQPALKGVSFTVPVGQIAAVVGAEKSGKTTLVSMPNRIIEPTSGEVTFADRPLKAYKKPDLRRSIGWAGGPAGLFGARTVLANVSTVPQLLGWPEHTARARGYEILQAVDLPRAVAARRPGELSRAEQVRVDLARALAGEPQLMVADDPFAGLEAAEAGDIAELIGRLRRRWADTWLLATATVSLAVTLADHLGVLDHAELVQYGPTVQVIDHPADDAVRRVLGDERGLLSLSLITAADLPLTSARTVRDPASVPAGSFALALDANGCPEYWVQGREADWVPLGLGVPFDPRQDTLRDALESVLTSPISRGIAVHRATGRYRGMVSADVVLDRATQHRLALTEEHLRAES